MATEVKVPDIGDFENVEIIEVHVKAGDEVQAEDPLITLESDKASMDVPSPESGTIDEIMVDVGDHVSEGDVIALMTVAGGAAKGNGKDKQEEASRKEEPKEEKPSPPAAGEKKEKAAAKGPAEGAKQPSGNADKSCEILVLGAGPGGYSAAFRAADLGKKVVLVERWPTLGGVCLNVGCIPSKALLHAAKVVSETREMSQFGMSFQPPELDYDKLRSWKNGIVKKLTGGLSGMAKQRKVEVITGVGRFSSTHEVTVENDKGETTVVAFEKAIIAAGSEPIELPFIPHDDPRVMDSEGALELEDFPKRLLVLGGGIIGLEMACVYHELGSKVTVVELMDQIIPGGDKDVVTPLMKRIQKQYENIFLKTKVTNVEAKKDGLEVTFEGEKAPEKDTFDKVLVAVGRKPNGNTIDAAAAGVEVDERGFIAADKQLRTNVPHIFAIGDIIGQPMLAHKAVHEGHVAAEAAAGKNSHFDVKCIPSVAYTDPEVAWAGLTENDCKAQGIKYGKGVFPWAASGRSLSINRDEGMTKLLFDEETDRVIGAGIVGPQAGDLISEAVLAIEQGADAADISLSIHPHPTLSETVGFAAEMFEGTITDLIPPKKKK